MSSPPVVSFCIRLQLAYVDMCHTCQAMCQWPLQYHRAEQLVGSSLRRVHGPDHQEQYCLSATDSQISGMFLNREIIPRAENAYNPGKALPSRDEGRKASGPLYSGRQLEFPLQ